MKRLSNIKETMMRCINGISKHKLLLSTVLVVGVSAIGSSLFAQATIGGMMQGVYSILGNILKLVQYGAVVAAVILAVMGIMTLKQASAGGQQGQQGQHKSGFIKIITAVGLLITVPLLQALQVQIAGQSSVTWSQGDTEAGTISTGAQCTPSAQANADWDHTSTGSSVTDAKAPCVCVAGWGGIDATGAAVAPAAGALYYGGKGLRCTPLPASSGSPGGG